MAQSPIIRTERLELHPFSRGYLTERYVSWLNDPRIVRWSEQRHRTHTLESCRDYVASFDDSPNFLWAIVDTKADQHLGNISATISVPNSVADIGILVGETEYWGKGVATEAWNAVMTYLLEDAGIRKVTAGTLEVNSGMMRVMAKCGMHEEGKRREQRVFEGEAVDEVYYAKF